ncbi:MAG: hypothetical protein K6G40_02200 [Eubacterium sp.]|nr:hypothetical protein [Eubacterium sp.]
MDKSELLLEKMEVRRQLRNTIGRISHDLCIKEDGMIYKRYWSKKLDVSLLLNDGGYKGNKAVEQYYGDCAKEIELSSKLIKNKFPDVFEGKTDEELYGVGMINYMPVDSHVIEVAEDFNTAKAIFNVRGSYCHLTGEGPIANWTYGYIAADFIKEDGKYKIWHMQILYNIDNPCGVNFIAPAKSYKRVEGFEAMDDYKMHEPNIKTKVEHYHPFRIVGAFPKVPEPYNTFEETFSYEI